MGQRHMHILDLDGVEYRIGSRLSVEPEAARPAGPKRCLTPVQASQMVSWPSAASHCWEVLQRARRLPWEPPAGTSEQAVSSFVLWTE